MVEISSSYLRLSVWEDEECFGVLLPEKLGTLCTPAGNPAKSDSHDFIVHMISELELHPFLYIEKNAIESPRQLSSYLLHSTALDYPNNIGPQTTEQVRDMLLNDPVLNPAAGPEWTYQLRAWASLETFLESLGSKLAPSANYSTEELEHLSDAIYERWTQLSVERKSVVQNLFYLTGGNLICSVALACDACTCIEYANAVLASSPYHYVFGHDEENKSPEEHHTDAFKEFRDLARTCTDYLSFFPMEAVSLIVEGGEREGVEFKSTLRWDLNRGCNNEEITHACMKTVCAFLNTNGGLLIIGVSDDGRAIGISKDNFRNEDKFLLHFFAKVKSSMGADVTTNVSANFDYLKGERVCVVRCTRSDRPVYMRSKGKDEEFFIRTGPSSERLGPSDMVSYIQSDRFVHR